VGALKRVRADEAVYVEACALPKAARGGVDSVAESAIGGDFDDGPHQIGWKAA
jgi:hypothetical protein